MDCVGHTSSTMVGVSAELAFTCWLVRKGRTKSLSPMRLSQFIGRISGDFVRTPMQNLALARCGSRLLRALSSNEVLAAEIGCSVRPHEISRLRVEAWITPRAIVIPAWCPWRRPVSHGPVIDRRRRRRRNHIDLTRRKRATEDCSDAKSSETGADSGTVPRLRRGRQRQRRHRHGRARHGNLESLDH